MTVNNDDILKVVMEVTLEDGTIAQNVYHLKCLFAAPQADGTVISEIEPWIEGMYSELSSEFVSTITQNPCSVDIVEFNETEGYWETTYHVGTFTPTIGFNNATDALPNMSSGLATFNTLRPKSRGRKFLFPWGEDIQDGTYITGAALTNLADYAAVVLSSLVIGPLNTMVYGICREGVDTFLEAFVAVVTNLLATQRRRRPGVGA